MPPQYIFNGDAPKPGENYRVALARDVTTDFQFARATVNYMWAHSSDAASWTRPTRSIPARLDPDNPPPAPWTLQPSNPALLNALAQHFVDHGYDLKALMREIANSELSALDPLRRRRGNPMGALLRAQIRAAPVGRGGSRRRGAVERHAAVL